MVKYSILGPVELRDGERRVAVGGPRQLTLLALLLVNANRALSDDRLIDTLWGDLDRAGALRRLHVTILRLRRTLDPEGVHGESALRRAGGGYLLAVGTAELDAEVFQTCLQEGLRARDAGDVWRARDLLRRALGLWRGPVLAEVAYEAFAQPEIRRLEELRLGALEARVDCDLRLGEEGGLIGELEALVAAHPGRERLAAQLMLALYRGGRQADALDVYARTRAYLSSELGLTPGPALQTMQVEILAQSPALQRVADEPGLAAWRVVLALPRSLQAPASSPFIGRDAELKRLRARWTEVREGARSTIVLGGEAGIGKTRLASELARTVHGEGALVLYGRCDEGLAMPYQPFVEALRPYIRAVGPDRVRTELGDLAPELGRLLPELAGLGEPVRADPGSERDALFEAVAALIEAMTRQRRALLVLDDLHWAATPTLLLLRHLLRSERPLGVLLVATFRETELDPAHALAQLLADMHRDASAERVRIRGLDQHAIAALLQAAVGNALDERASELVHALATQTAGNPFFIRELLAHMSESGTILFNGERSSPDFPVAQLEIPERLRQVIDQRVARLSAPAGQLLRVAAVAGARFSFALLERVLGQRSGALDALDEAVAAGLLNEAGHGDHVFAHALVRQAVYRQLGSARRIRLHRQLGEALEALGDADANVEALAHHFAHAAADGQAVKAAAYALVAGRSATARLAYEDAAAHYERGLQALRLNEQPHDERRCELLLALGEAHWGAGELDKARQAYRQAAELAGRLGDATARAHAALGYCGPHRFEAAAAVTAPVADLLQRALIRLGDDDSGLRAQLMGRLAATLAFTDVEHRKPALARQALDMARRVGDKATLADVLASIHWATHGPDSLRESVDLADELGRVADEIGDRRLAALAHVQLLDHHLELGDIDAVEHELDALRLLAQTRRDCFFTWLLTIIRANQARLDGRLEDCETLAHEALSHRYEGDDEIAPKYFRMQIGFIRLEQGRLDELVEAFEGVAAQYPQLAAWRCGLAYIYAQVERPAQARHELEALARADFGDLPRDVDWLSSLSLLSEVVVFLGDRRRAQLLYSLLMPYADRCVVFFALLCHGSASRSLGLLASMLSRYEDAARHFQQALTMNAQIKSPLWTAHTQHDYARMLLLRNGPGDRDKARELLQETLAVADQFGLKALADKAISSRSSLTPPRR